MCKELVSRLSSVVTRVLDFISPKFGSPDYMDGAITPPEMLLGVIEHVRREQPKSIKVFHNQQGGLELGNPKPIDNNSS